MIAKPLILPGGLDGQVSHMIQLAAESCPAFIWFAVAVAVAAALTS
jgi:hypothetical protein